MGTGNQSTDNRFTKSSWRDSFVLLMVSLLNAHLVNGRQGDRNERKVLFYFIVKFLLFQTGMCLFSTEFQGEYMTQSSSRDGVNLQ